MSGNRGDRTRIRSERGSVLLLWALTFSVTVLMFVQGYFPFFQTTVSTTAQNFRREQALALADAGLEHALWELRSNNGANLPVFGTANGWTKIEDPPTTCDDEIDGDADGRLYGLAVTSCHTATRTVDAGDWFAGTIGTYRVWVVNIGSSLVRAVAQGYAPTQTNPLSTRTVAVDVEDPGTSRYAALGDDYMEIHGKVTIESYNSNNGAFNATTNRFENGDIGTNGSRGLLYDLTIDSPDSGLIIDGTEYLATGTQHQYVNALTDGPNAVMPQSIQVLPTAVTVPTALTALTVTTTVTPTWTGFTGNYAGDFTCTGTCVCSSPTHIKSLYVTGTVQMDAGCQLFVDRQDSTVPYTLVPGGAILDTDGTGQLIKTSSTETTKIFIKDGAFNLDGQGMNWAAAIGEAARIPERLQLYATGTNAAGALAQSQPFYGMVFVADPDGNASEAGELSLLPGNTNGVLSTGMYHGAFIAGGRMIISNTNAGMYDVIIRYDEALRGLLLDGSGNRIDGGFRYTLLRRSWQPKYQDAAISW